MPKFFLSVCRSCLPLWQVAGPVRYATAVFLTLVCRIPRVSLGRALANPDGSVSRSLSCHLSFLATSFVHLWLLLVTPRLDKSRPRFHHLRSRSGGIRVVLDSFYVTTLPLTRGFRSPSSFSDTGPTNLWGPSWDHRSTCIPPSPSRLPWRDAGPGRADELPHSAIRLRRYAPPHHTTFGPATSGWPDPILVLLEPQRSPLHEDHSRRDRICAQLTPRREETEDP